jgi:hypothetical protein
MQAAAAALGRASTQQQAAQAQASRQQQRKECTRISGVFGENGRNILESVNVPFFLSFLG